MNSIGIAECICLHMKHRTEHADHQLQRLNEGWPWLTVLKLSDLVLARIHHQDMFHYAYQALRKHRVVPWQAWQAEWNEIKDRPIQACLKFVWLDVKLWHRWVREMRWDKKSVSFLGLLHDLCCLYLKTMWIWTWLEIDGNWWYFDEGRVSIDWARVEHWSKRIDIWRDSSYWSFSAIRLAELQKDKRIHWQRGLECEVTQIRARQHYFWGPMSVSNGACYCQRARTHWPGKRKEDVDDESWWNISCPWRGSESLPASWYLGHGVYLTSIDAVFSLLWTYWMIWKTTKTRTFLISVSQK